MHTHKHSHMDKCAMLERRVTVTSKYQLLMFLPFLSSISISSKISSLEHSLSAWIPTPTIAGATLFSIWLFLTIRCFYDSFFEGNGLSYIFNARLGSQNVFKTFHLIDWFIKLIQWLRSNTYFSGVFMHLNLILTNLRQK